MEESPAPDPFDFPVNFTGDSLATGYLPGFGTNSRFLEAYAQGKATGSWGLVDPMWRVHVACWAAERAVGLEGDFVECGVNLGGIAKTVCHYLGFETLQKSFHLVDTFEGMPQTYVLDKEREVGIPHEYAHYGSTFDTVKSNFSAYPNVFLHKGLVPDILPSVPAQKVAWLSLDMNHAYPEIAAATYFWPRMVSGAAMILDDYGNPLHAVQKAAFDDWADKQGVPILSMPCGNAVILKP